MTTFIALLFVLLVGSLIGYYFQPIKQKVGEISTYGLSSLFVAPNSEPVVTAVLLPTPSAVPTTTPQAISNSALTTSLSTPLVTQSNSLPQTGPGETMLMLGLAIAVVLTYLILMRERRISLQKAWRSISVAD